MKSKVQSGFRTVYLLLFLILHANDRSVCLAQSFPPVLRAEAKDFSKTNSVTIDLSREDGDGGLKHLHLEKDGRTYLMGINGTPCRCLNMPERATAYLYFVIDPSFKEMDLTSVRIEVEYFDALEETPSIIGIHYDATGLRENGESAYARSAQSARLSGTQNWKLATFEIKGGTFQNSQNSGADFRIVVSPAKLCVKSVKVTRLERRDDDPIPSFVPALIPEQKLNPRIDPKRSLTE